MVKMSLLLGLSLLLSGCALGDKGPGSLPYRAWFLGFRVPDYMEVWVETATVEDVNGRIFYNMGGGVASIYKPTNGSGNASGWGTSKTKSGAGREIDGAAMPERIFVRWQSLAEPQTYKAVVSIPERVRELMLKPEDADCAVTGKVTDYRRYLTLGLAPGGSIKAWVLGPCLGPIEVFRAQAEIEPKGPYGGESGGHHRRLSEVSKAYIQQHGIPYGSW